MLPVNWFVTQCFLPNFVSQKHFIWYFLPETWYKILTNWSLLSNAFYLILSIWYLLQVVCYPMLAIIVAIWCLLPKHNMCFFLPDTYYLTITSWYKKTITFFLKVIILDLITWNLLYYQPVYLRKTYNCDNIFYLIEYLISVSSQTSRWLLQSKFKNNKTSTLMVVGSNIKIYCMLTYFIPELNCSLQKCMINIYYWPQQNITKIGRQKLQ